MGISTKTTRIVHDDASEQIKALYEVLSEKLKQYYFEKWEVTDWQVRITLREGSTLDDDMFYIIDKYAQKQRQKEERTGHINVSTKDNRLVIAVW